MLDYASSDFDIRHRFTLTATYNLPNIKSPFQMLEGWKINTVLTIRKWTALAGERFVEQFQRNQRKYGPVGFLREPIQLLFPRAGLDPLLLRLRGWRHG